MKKIKILGVEAIQNAAILVRVAEAVEEGTIKP